MKRRMQTQRELRRELLKNAQEAYNAELARLIRRAFDYIDSNPPADGASPEANEKYDCLTSELEDLLEELES